MKAGSDLLPDAQPVNDAAPCICPADPTAQIPGRMCPVSTCVHNKLSTVPGGWRLKFRLRRPPLGRGRPLREDF